MAYRSVGTPRFYIDQWIYLNSLGLDTRELWGNSSSPFGWNTPSLLSDDPNYLGDGHYFTPYQHPEVFTLTPNKQYLFSRGESDRADWFNWIFPTGMNTMPPDADNVGWYGALLNHSIYDESRQNYNQVSNSLQGMYMSWYNYDDGAGSTSMNSIGQETGSGDQFWANQDSAINVLNREGAYIENNGTSIFTSKMTYRIPKYVQVGIRGDVGQNNTIGHWVGGVSCGLYYDMPHSPDLKLTMETEFDGYDSITTLGGSTLTRRRYTGSPWWYNWADGTGNIDASTVKRIEPFGVGRFSDVNYGEDFVTYKSFTKRNGRRSWTLKFSYLKSSDLFASNPMAETYMNLDDTGTSIDPYLIGEDVDSYNWNINILKDPNLSADVADGVTSSDDSAIWNSKAAGTYWLGYNGTYIDDGYAIFGKNLLSNPSFDDAGDSHDGGTGETNFANWAETPGSGTIARSTNVYEGTYSCSLQTASGNEAYMAQTFTTIQNALYRLSFYSRGDGSNDLMFSVVQSSGGDGLVMYQGNTGVSTEVSSTEIIANGGTQTGNTSTDWVKHRVWFKAKDTSSTVYFKSPELSSTSGTAYVDKVHITNMGTYVPNDDTLPDTGTPGDNNPAYQFRNPLVGNSTYQTSLTSGVSYKITINVSEYTSGEVYLLIGGGGISAYPGATGGYWMEGFPYPDDGSGKLNVTSAGLHYFYVTANQTGTLSLYSTGGSTKGGADIDNDLQNTAIMKIDYVNAQPLNANNSDFKYNINTDPSFEALVLNKIGSGQKFIFQPDNTANNPGDFAICVLDQDSLKVTQVAHNTFDCQMKIKEVW